MSSRRAIKKTASPHWDCPRFSRTRGTLTKPRCIPTQSRDLSHFEACNRSSSPEPHVAQCHLTCAQCCRHCRGNTKEWVRAALRLQVGGQGTCAALCHPWFGKVKEVFFFFKLTTLHLWKDCQRVSWRLRGWGQKHESVAAALDDIAGDHQPES